MAAAGYLPYSLIDSLKGGLGKDSDLAGGIGYLTCGRNKVFFTSRATRV